MFSSLRAVRGAGGVGVFGEPFFALLDGPPAAPSQSSSTLRMA